MRRFFAIGGLLIFLLLLTVTVSTSQGTEVSIKDSEKTKNLNPLNGYIKYDPAGRRDPFLSILIITKQKLEKHQKRKKNPLENVDITEVKLLGIVKKGDRYFASVLLPDGKAFTITKGTSVGLYDGKVIDIGLDRVVVREYVMDYKGRIKPKNTILKLRKEEE